MGKEKSVSTEIRTFDWFNKKYSKSSHQLNKKEIELLDIMSELNKPLTNLTKHGRYNLKAYLLAIEKYIFKSSKWTTFIEKNSKSTSIQGIVIAGSNEDYNKEFYMDFEINPDFVKYIIDNLTNHFCDVFNETQKLLRTPKRSIGKNKKLMAYKTTPQLIIDDRANEDPFIARLDYCELDTKKKIINNFTKCKDIGEIVANQSDALFLPVGIKIHKNFKLYAFEDFFPAYAVYLNNQFEKKVENGPYPYFKLVKAR